MIKSDGPKSTQLSVQYIQCEQHVQYVQYIQCVQDVQGVLTGRISNFEGSRSILSCSRNSFTSSLRQSLIYLGITHPIDSISLCKVLHALVHILWLSPGAFQADHLDEDIHSTCLVPRLLVNLCYGGLLHVRSLCRQEVWSEDCQ